MAELNKILLIGRLTKDPDLRYTPAGMAVATLRMAVNHTYRTKEEKKQEVLYIDVNVWGKQAETVKQYLGKGRELFIEGRLQQDEWTDKTNQKRISYRVVADRFNFIGGGNREGGARDGGAREMAAEESGGAPAESGGGAPAEPSGGPAAEPYDAAEPPTREQRAPTQDDDLPF